MKRLLFLIALFASPAMAQATYTAAGCTSANFTAIYATEQASKVDGDIIAIPSCTGTWSTVSISPTNSLTIQGNSTTTGTCAPGGTCTATDNTNITLSAAITFTTATGKSFRVTGMSFTGTAGPLYGEINFSGSSTAVRIDHNHFTDNVMGGHTLQISNIRGVADHNYFQTPLGENINFIQVTNPGTDGNANTIWTQVEGFGTSDFFYIENNFFTGSFVYDCDIGGKIALRYNIVSTGSMIQTHGTGSGAQVRGCRATETYSNTFTYSASPNTNSFPFLVDYESGPSMVWGNTVTAFTTLLRQQEVRANNDTYTQVATPNGFGYCGTDFNGTGSNWDQNSPATTGKACLDQVGRGAGDLLTGLFPSLVNSTTGTIAWPHQTLVPTYAWMNTLNTNTFAPNHYWVNEESPARVTENTEYYIQLPNVDEGTSFNGTAGTGSGLLSARPSTCTPTVGYFATDQGAQGTLYLCLTTNAWTASYIPYTYPHPLVGAVPPPPASTNKSIFVGNFKGAGNLGQ